MNHRAEWILRTADETDHGQLAALLSAAQWKHQHLDWIAPRDLLDKSAFVLATEGGLPAGCLACPPDPVEVAWLRLFAVAPAQPLTSLWEMLWTEGAQQAFAAGARHAAALLLGEWLTPLLVEAGFQETNAVIFMERTGTSPLPAPAIPGDLRSMKPSDLPTVAEVDRRAFGRIWRHSQETLVVALRQASLATVVELEGRPVAYQISTGSALGAHVARLAVDPEWQGRGLGTALIAHALRQLGTQGFHRVTVNTQEDNLAGRRLYRRLGFVEGGQRFPVYERALGP